jgi:hypothetical protein
LLRNDLETFEGETRLGKSGCAIMLDKRVLQLALLDTATGTDHDLHEFGIRAKRPEVEAALPDRFVQAHDPTNFVLVLPVLELREKERPRFTAGTARWWQKVAKWAT